MGMMGKLQRGTLGFCSLHCSSMPKAGEQSRRTEGNPSKRFWSFSKCSAAGFQSLRARLQDRWNQEAGPESQENTQWPRKVKVGCKWKNYQTFANAQSLSLAKGKHFKSILSKILSQWWTNLTRATRKLRLKSNID